MPVTGGVSDVGDKVQARRPEDRQFPVRGVRVGLHISQIILRYRIFLPVHSDGSYVKVFFHSSNPFEK